MTHLKAAIFDWAGATDDFGSFASVRAMINALAKFGIDIAIEEARPPMAAAKWIDIHALLQMPQVANRWLSNCGNTLNGADVDAVFKVFVPMSEIIALDYANLIPAIP
jgi:phosphonoacetaldehyde hydrolase